MARSWEKMRHLGFDRAIRKSVVKEPKWRARIPNGFISWAMAQYRPISPIKNRHAYQAPEINPRTQQYVEHTWGLMEAPAGTVPWLIELSRIVIPDNRIGIIKGLEQVLTHSDLESPQYFSTSANWGNPFPFPPTVDVTWYLRLERVTGVEPAQLNISAVGVQALLPGEPHFDLPELHDLWFPASSAASQNIHLAVGGRYRLRLCAIVERTAEYALSISGKLKGFHLSSFDSYTLLPVRSIW